MEGVRAGRRRFAIGATTLFALAASSVAIAQDKKPDFPPFDKVSEGYKEVPGDGGSLWTVYRDSKDEQLLAELPRNFESQDLAIATSVSAGSIWASYQGTGAWRYVKWQRIGDRLALIEPNTSVRSSGDAESRDSIKRHFTDRVLLDVPIKTMGPGGGPVIDLDALLLGNANKFFGGMGGGAARSLNTRLATIETLKCFPENVEIGLEAPAGNGTLTTIRYSISVLKGTPGYKPREADERVGYFTTDYRDLGKYRSDEKYVRYINRWHLEKRDPKLNMSLPKQPIVFYVEHTVPVRYRPYVKEGIEYWNKAFEQVGIRNAIEVEFQDKATGKHMDKDPEDVRYNFVGWLSNDISTAIGPSRAHPETGEILDADIVLTDGWIRAFDGWWSGLMPAVAMEGFGPETMAWLAQNPQWDPRVRLAEPTQRAEVMADVQREYAELGPRAFSKYTTGVLECDDSLCGGAACQAATHKAYSMALVRMMIDMPELAGLDMGEGEGDGEGEGGEGDDEPKGDVLDGIPESFIGPLLADLVAHEVGHTLGLRHNFKASSIYTLEEINSPELKDSAVWSGSVMDYHPLNINVEDGEIQGDWAPIGIGPYDMWAIEYGYTFGKTDKVLERVAEPHLVYATDEDTGGPDPLARRYDLSKDPLDYANSRVRLANKIRETVLDNYVKEGQSWSRARRGYEVSLSEQARGVSIMSGWIGGAFINRDRKGDPNGRAPINPVPAETQRKALRFVIDNSFHDDAFGLTPDLLRYMTVDKWWDNGGAMREPTWPVHDRIMGLQASALTQIMNPTTLRRVYDNEYLVPSDEDALTLPELMFTVSDDIWSELDDMKTNGTYTARQPMISSLRRNLQREHLERLIDLTKPSGFLGAAQKPISNLALHKLRELDTKLEGWLTPGKTSRIDPYTEAHLSEAKTRVEQVLAAEFIYNTDDISSGGGFPGVFFFNAPQGDNQAPAPAE